MKHKLLALVLSLATLWLAAVAVQGQSSAAAWTFMIYIAGDNDLEPYIINDLMELQAIGSSDEVNIVAQVDRTPEYEAINGNWDDTRRFYITQATGDVSTGDFEISIENLIDEFLQFSPEDFGLTAREFDAEVAGLQRGSQAEAEQFAFNLFGSPPGGGAPTVGLQQESLELLGETNTGDPETLVDFALWAIENYPAEHYGLILWDHGGGWLMIGSDETDDADALTMTELSDALYQITETAGIDKFDVIGFDACLMAQLEVFQTLAPYAEYAIASEELIPGMGWEYAGAFRQVVEHPSSTAPEFGQAVVDAYVEYYGDVYGDSDNYDLHVIDLSQVDQVSAALDNFAAVVEADPEDALSAIGNARNNARVFGGTDPESVDYFSSIDLVELMNYTIALSRNDDLSDAAQEVIDAVSQMVVYGNYGGADGANGTSIYFPFTSEIFEWGGEKYPDEISEAMYGWLSFLYTFHGTAHTVYSENNLSISISQVFPDDETASIHNPPVVWFESDGAGIIDMTFIASLLFEDGTQIIIDQSSLDFTYIDANGQEINVYPEGYSENEFTWNAETPIITDGAVGVPTVLQTDPESPDIGIVTGVYTWRNGRETTASLVFDLETQQVISVWGSETSQAGNGLAQIQPTPGDQFMPYWYFVDESGEIEEVPSESYLTFSSEPFSFEFVPAESGEYLLSLLIEDMAGNVEYDQAVIAIDNDGLDGDWRGYKDIQAGINFLYPWEWNSPLMIEGEDGGYTFELSDPEGSTFIYVNVLEVEDSDELLDEAFSILDGAEASEPEEDSIDGNDAYFISYSYEDEDGEVRYGQLAVVYVPDNGLGYIVDLDGSEDADEIFTAIIESLNFFPPVE